MSTSGTSAPPKLPAFQALVIAKLVSSTKTGMQCETLSSGEQTRVQLAKAFLNEPCLLLLDEPTASLDPSAPRDTRDRIRQYAAANEVGVLWTSHNMRDALPPASVFDSMRRIVDGRPVSPAALAWSGGLSVFYLLLAAWVFGRIHRHAIRVGLIAHYSAESLG